MKIAFVYDAVYPYVKGGAEKRIWELSKRLSERGHEIHLFGMKWWVGESVIENEGIHLHGVCMAMPLYTQNGKRSIKQALWFSAALFPSLLKKDFDVIDCSAFPYFQCFTSKACAMVKRKPLIITWLEVWGEYWYEYLGRSKGFVGRGIEKFASKLPDQIISISEKTRGRLTEELQVNNSKIVTIPPTGIDLDEIRKIPKSKESFDIIFAGRLIKDKNADVLIKAISIVKEKIPNVKCVIIGEGPERKKIENLAEKLNIGNNIKFLEFMKDHRDVISYMKSSKIFVLPSTREGFGIVVLEANACGLPVIAIKHPMNAAEDLIIDGETGFKVELSEEVISEKIIQLLEKEELRREMSEYSKNYVKVYDWPNIINRTEEVYINLIEKWQKPR
ncbi:MAG: hypothetical protein MSIBF_07020 [Candidatus Altiarchaeales archaeon IMC4]|nr:MAG: hypothetical protein MSIBF_07020 [Candidatus Altiarchaeales archaeon IMC4]